MKDIKFEMDEKGNVIIPCLKCGNSVVIPPKALDVVCNKCGHSLIWKVRIKVPASHRGY